MESLFLKALEGWGWPAYMAIFVALFLEGELVLFTTVYLASNGILKIGLLIPTLFLGTLFGDTFWYFLGEYLDKKHPWVHKWFGKITGPINRRLASRPAIVIFVSKFTYGLNKATLLRARMNGIKFKKFITAELFTILCWMSIIGNLAWFASASSDYLRHYVKYAEVGLLLGIAVMSLFLHLLAIVAKKMIAGNENRKLNR